MKMASKSLNSIENGGAAKPASAYQQKMWRVRRSGVMAKICMAANETAT